MRQPLSYGALQGKRTARPITLVGARSRWKQPVTAQMLRFEADMAYDMDQLITLLRG